MSGVPPLADSGSARGASASGSATGRSSAFLSPAEQKARAEQRAKSARAAKKAKAAAALQQKKQEALDAEVKRARDLSNHRWKDCLACLQANPWLVVLEPRFIHDYLDALTETLANLSRHESDLELVRSVLQDVYEAFVDVGRFAKYQPAFYISDPYTIRRFVRLLEQVAHRGSDKALFPNVLSLLGPTFEREELYGVLSEARVVHALLSFARTGWMPSGATLSLLLAIIEQLSSSALLRDLFMEDAGFPKLQQLAMGLVEGFTKEQQAQAQQALALYPPPEVTPAMSEEEAAHAAEAAQAAAAHAAQQEQQAQQERLQALLRQTAPPDAAAAEAIEDAPADDAGDAPAEEEADADATPANEAPADEQPDDAAPTE